MMFLYFIMFDFHSSIPLHGCITTLVFEILNFASRSCGLVFCNRCSSHSMALPHYGIDRPVRVCNRCILIMQYSSSSTSTASTNQGGPSNPTAEGVIYSRQTFCEQIWQNLQKQNLVTSGPLRPIQGGTTTTGTGISLSLRLRALALVGEEQERPRDLRPRTPQFRVTIKGTICRGVPSVGISGWSRKQRYQMGGENGENSSRCFQIRSILLHVSSDKGRLCLLLLNLERIKMEMLDL